MEKNCLVTKLKGVVDNDNLPKFNVLKVHFGAGDSGQYGSIRIEVPVGNANTNNGYIANNAANLQNQDTHISITNAISLFASNVEMDIEISPKYDITTLQTIDARASFDTNDVKYLTKLTKLSMKTSSCTGNLEDLVKLTNLEQLSVSGSHIYGDIDTISAATNLSNFDISYTGARISGSLESFAKKQFIARGRQSASITLNTTSNTLVTFNGSAANANSTLSWALKSGSSTILEVTYNSTTVEVSL